VAENHVVTPRHEVAHQKDHVIPDAAAARATNAKAGFKADKTSRQCDPFQSKPPAEAGGLRVEASSRVPCRSGKSPTTRCPIASAPGFLKTRLIQLFE